MLTVLLLATLAVAKTGDDNDAKILGKDDIEFAKALQRGGYPDLADEFMAAYARVHGSSPDAAGGAESVRRGLEEERCWREPDLDKRLDCLTKIVEEAQAFVAQNSGSPAATETLDHLTDMYRGIGELITTLLQEKDIAPARVTELRTKGSSMFERAVDALKARMDALQKRVAEDEAKNADNPDQALAEQYMLSRYNLARTYYFHGLLLEANSFTKKSRLESALNVLSDFSLDYGDQLLCFEGYIYEGLCHRELDQLDAAVESFDYAISLREKYERASDGTYKVDDAAGDIISSAVVQKMQVLSKKGDHAGAAAIARDFLATIPNAPHTLKGLLVLSQAADEYKELGDSKQVQAIAKMLIDSDPNGPGGERGRELLGGAAPTIGAGDKMKLAQTSFGRGDIDRAISLCQEVMTEARGDTDAGVAPDDNLGATSGLLLGTCFTKRGWYHEAAVAWDGAADRFQKGKDAPDCMWSAITMYTELQKQEQTPYYKSRARDRMSELATRYPNSQYASQSSIIEGQQTEADQQYVKAADIYQRIKPGSAGYEEGLYRAGGAWYREARRLRTENKSADIKQAVEKAEELLKKAEPALLEAANKTLEIQAQDRFRGFAFAARVTLGELYLMEGVNRPNDVLTLFGNVENEFPDDQARIGAARGLRLRALLQAGKLDDAISLLDSIVRDDPNAQGLADSAAKLASALDQRGAELFKKDPNSRDVDDIWRKAARFYVLAMRGQLEGNEAVRLDRIEPIAGRLFALAQHFNRIPTTVDSFIEWNGPRVDTDLFEQAQRAYEAVVPLTPSYRALIALAQTQGYLGKWVDAATYYAQLFEHESLADLNTRTLKQDVLRAKPELIFAFLEWGVCEREAGVKDNDTSRLSRASSIFETMVQGTAPSSKLWWQSKYYQVRTLVDRGEYNYADIAIRDVERGNPDYDGGQYGLKDKFTKVRDELATKLRSSPPPPTKK